MVWGEPNRSDRFRPNAPSSPRGPRRYAELLDAAYEALKGTSAQNIVIGGMTFTGGEVDRRTSSAGCGCRLAYLLGWTGTATTRIRFASPTSETIPFRADGETSATSTH